MFFWFKETGHTGIYTFWHTLSLPAALPVSSGGGGGGGGGRITRVVFISLGRLVMFMPRKKVIAMMIATTTAIAIRIQPKLNAERLRRRNSKLDMSSAVIVRPVAISR